jgi:hypothetical protein
MRHRVLAGIAAVVVVTGVAAGTGTRAQSGAAVAYPDGYRSWFHVKSMVINQRTHPLFEAFGGIHHVYVNAAGAAAARRGGSYPDGTVFVFDLLDATSDGGAIVEGARKFTAVMVKDARASAATGGWGFQAFKGDSRDERVVGDGGKQCFACHASQKARDYVFSRPRP